ncbi:hypothetical protein JG687_00014366 [Phytophthora cactorum]|uniref:Uncharacterized protein n=1 Tax=Phytophthora cactorum TaxID=29920 RepID=A0A8T1TYY5_9STRA|nr:hypothetical protein JG687_00014366 [Phytophthora cactorum]
MCNSSPFARSIYTTLHLDDQQKLILTERDTVEEFITQVLVIRLQQEPSFTATTPLGVIDTSNDAVFSGVLNIHEARLPSVYGPTVISLIWAQRKEVRDEYNDKHRVKKVIDSLSKLDVKRPWYDSEFDQGFRELQEVALGLASTPPGTHTVEADFSLLRRMKSKLRTQLSDFSLEGELHTGQYCDVVNATADIISET